MLRARPPKTGVEEKAKNRKETMALVKRIPKPKPVPCGRDGVELGQIVLCKIRGATEWPAIVSDIDKSSITVEFFGDQTKYTTSIKNFFSFELSTEYILQNLKRSNLHNGLYKKAVQEAELLLGISDEMSLLRKL